MSQFDYVFAGKKYFECKKCGSLAIIDNENKLMRMVMTKQGVPVIYEEKRDRNLFLDQNNKLKCDCID